jgi:hypothetical protein
MIRAVVLVLMAGASGALASDSWQVDQSWLQIVPGRHCVAEIHITNHRTDTRSHGSADVSIGALTVGVSFILNAGLLAADRFTAEPPEGFIAVPPSVDVPDGETGLILICDENAVGA